MRLDETFSKGSNPISRCPATNRLEFGGAVGYRRKLLIYWFLCRYSQPTPRKVSLGNRFGWLRLAAAIPRPQVSGRRSGGSPARSGLDRSHRALVTRHVTDLEACAIFKSAARLFATGRGSKLALWLSDHFRTRSTRDCWVLLKAPLMPCAPGWGAKWCSSLTGHPRRLGQLHAACCPSLAAPPLLSSRERAPESAVT